MIEYLDKHNKSLKNNFSKQIIDKLLDTIPNLINEEHFEWTKKLLVLAEDQNLRLTNRYSTTVEILKQWIALGQKSNTPETVTVKQTELILLFIDNDDLKDAAGIYLDLAKKDIILDLLAKENSLDE